MNQLKSTMLYATSHEFRNPLSGIISMLALLEPVIPDSSKYFLNIAKASADLLMFLANDMLDYAQIESGKITLNFQKFDVKQTVDELIGLLTFKAKSKGVYLKVNNNIEGPSNNSLEAINTESHLINNDQNRFKQVLINLISNAIKFTMRGGITVSL